MSLFRNIYNEIFETCADYMAIPVYIGNHHFTIGGILELLLFVAIVAIILGILVRRS